MIMRIKTYSKIIVHTEPLYKICNLLLLSNIKSCTWFVNLLTSPSPIPTTPPPTPTVAVTIMGPRGYCNCSVTVYNTV